MPVAVAGGVSEGSDPHVPPWASTERSIITELTDAETAAANRHIAVVRAEAPVFFLGGRLVVVACLPGFRIVVVIRWHGGTFDK